jgi:predicted lactoylglutathione lyase
MGTKIFINLPVKNLEKTSRFFEKMGYSFNPQFSDEKAKCMVISEDIYVMFLVEQFFRSFTGKEISDTSKTCDTIMSLTAESPAAVDKMMEKCIAAGGKDISKPQEVDFMYTRTFEDPDGHHWEIFHMDMAKVPTEPKAQHV